MSGADISSLDVWQPNDPYKVETMKKTTLIFFRFNQLARDFKRPLLVNDPSFTNIPVKRKAVQKFNN